MVQRRPAMATTQTDLVIPDQPCSNECVYHLGKHELELSDSQERPKTTFTRDQLSALLLLLPVLEMWESTYCVAATMIIETTCQQVSLELVIFAYD
jgi:hypothetical protein